MNTLPRLKNALNRAKFPVQGEKFTLPSMTIPDQTMSVQQILDRYSRGLPLGGQKVPIYDGEEFEPPDLKRMDISEIEDLKASNRDEVLALQKKLEDTKDKKLRADIFKELEKKYPKKTASPEGGREGDNQTPRSGDDDKKSHK